MARHSDTGEITDYKKASVWSLFIIHKNIKNFNEVTQDGQRQKHWSK